MIVDVVLGLQYGDEGKGKVTHYLANQDDYDYVLRFNGGGNAGHTIYHNGKKIITHHIKVAGHRPKTLRCMRQKNSACTGINHLPVPPGPALLKASST